MRAANIHEAASNRELQPHIIKGTSWTTSVDFKSVAKAQVTEKDPIFSTVFKDISGLQTSSGTREMLEQEQ